MTGANVGRKFTIKTGKSESGSIKQSLGGRTILRIKINITFFIISIKIWMLPVNIIMIGNV